MEPARRAAHRRVRLLIRDRFVAINRRDWFLVESDFRNDSRDITFDVPNLSDRGLDWTALFRYGAVDRRDCLHRRFQRRHHFPRFEDGLSDWVDTEVSTSCHSLWGTRFGTRAWSDSAGGQQRLYGLCARGET